MKLALIQTKQNELYNFPGTRTFDTEEVLRLRHEYMEEVFRMTEEAAKEGADLIVTTEVVNYSGHFSKIKVICIRRWVRRRKRHQLRKIINSIMT